jgi:hypothetical protein
VGRTRARAGERGRRDGGDDPQRLKVQQSLTLSGAQSFATRPVERLLAPGVTGAGLSDDCLSVALDTS